MKFTADTPISNVLKASSKNAEILKKYGLNCAGCRGAEQDTILKAAENYGIDSAALLSKLNKA